MLSLALTIFCLIKSWWFGVILIANISYTSSREKIGKKPYFVLLALFSLLTNLFVICISYLLFVLLLVEPFEKYSIIITGFVFALIVYPQLSVEKWFLKVLELIKIEKYFHDKFENYPDLLCKKHKTRTVKENMILFSKIRCRIDTDCGPRNLDIVENIIGLVGKHTKVVKYENNFYITLYNHWKDEVYNGDFDIIEIHETDEIENFDSVISKVVSHLYNEIDRFKPLHQVVVKIIGNIELSENTKHILDEHFFKIEYASD